eukprot:4909072-Lingulodinium_polyedra.AAC.1
MLSFLPRPKFVPFWAGILVTPRCARPRCAYRALFVTATSGAPWFFVGVYTLRSMARASSSAAHRRIERAAGTRSKAVCIVPSV